MQGLGRNPSGEDKEFKWEMFGREREVPLSREIGEKWEKFVLKLYIENTKLNGSRGVKSCWALIHDIFSVEVLSRAVHSKETLMDRTTIEPTESFSMDREFVEKLSRQILKSFNGSRLRLLLSRGVEKLSRCAKTIFQRREKHKNECNQACYSTKDPINILNSQKHLSPRKIKHLDPKHTHTHTKQV